MFQESKKTFILNKTLKRRKHKMVVHTKCDTLFKQHKNKRNKCRERMGKLPNTLQSAAFENSDKNSETTQKKMFKNIGRPYKIINRRE